jgi:5-methylcytosine-specific restriction endonuclease McrA
LERKVLVTLRLTPDQYAILQQATSKVSAVKGRRVSRETVVTEAARHFIASGSDQAKVRYQVVVHDEEGGCWYHTDRGRLPVSDKVQQMAKARPAPPPTDGQVLLTEVRRRSTPIATSSPNETPSASPGKSKKARSRIPLPVLRSLYQRSHGCCEKCRRAPGVQVHHVVPVSEGGDHSLDNLLLLCQECHETTHHDDFGERFDWRAARDRRRRSRQKG